jgi:hypothetical protein
MKRRRSRVDWYLPQPGDGPRIYEEGPPPLAVLLAQVALDRRQAYSANVVNLADYRAANLGGKTT